MPIRIHLCTSTSATYNVSRAWLISPQIKNEYVQNTYSRDKCDKFEKIPSGRIERLQCFRYLFNNINTNGALPSIQQQYYVSLWSGENYFLPVDLFITNFVKIHIQFARIVILTGKITL